MTNSTAAAVLARAIPIALAVSATSCGGAETISPARPVMRSMDAMLFTSNRGGDFDIYVMAADGTGARAVTRTAGVDQAAAWSPDGYTVAFMSTRDGDFEIFAMFADGRGLRLETDSTDAKPGRELWRCVVAGRVPHW